MKLIKPSFEILTQKEGLQGIYEQIELAGRTCYKSEDKITPDSAKEFVERMIKSGHGAMLEHGTVYLKIPWNHPLPTREEKYTNNKYSQVVRKLDSNLVPIWYITTNYRVLVENNWLDDLKYVCEPSEHHKKRISVRFICDRGVSHEFVRHRVFSFAQESTRYCNYSKDKFNNHCTFIIPDWIDLKEAYYDIGEWEIYPGYYISDTPLQYGMVIKVNEDEHILYFEGDEDHWLRVAAESEYRYKKLLEHGWTPQQARSVLPNSLKTELVMTGFVTDWEHFFKLRTAPSAHPQARELAIPLEEEFKKIKLSMKKPQPHKGKVYSLRNALDYIGFKYNIDENTIINTFKSIINTCSITDEGLYWFNFEDLFLEETSPIERRIYELLEEEFPNISIIEI